MEAFPSHSWLLNYNHFLDICRAGIIIHNAHEVDAAHDRLSRVRGKVPGIVSGSIIMLNALHKFTCFGINCDG